jgi:hypothetical protein
VHFIFLWSPIQAMFEYILMSFVRAIPLYDFWKWLVLPDIAHMCYGWFSVSHWSPEVGGTVLNSAWSQSWIVGHSIDIWKLVVLITLHICYQKWWQRNTAEVIIFGCFRECLVMLPDVSFLGTYVLCEINSGKTLKLGKSEA